MIYDYMKYDFERVFYPDIQTESGSDPFQNTDPDPKPWVKVPKKGKKQRNEINLLLKKKLINFSTGKIRVIG